MRSLATERGERFARLRQDKLLFLNPLCGVRLIFPAERSCNLRQKTNTRKLVYIIV